MPNIKILRKTLAKIAKLDLVDEELLQLGEEQIGEYWFQGEWTLRKKDQYNICGTAACFAGWVYNDFCEKITDDTSTTKLITEAREKMELDMVSFNVLTEGSNTLEDIEGIINTIEANGSITTEEAIERGYHSGR